MKSVKQEFYDTMHEVGINDHDLVVLVGDIGHFGLQPFAQACPGRFYNVGILEQCIINMSGGLSKLGFNVVSHSINSFIQDRPFEQIKLLGYQQLGINLIGVGSAFDYSSLGSTHHTLDTTQIKNIENTQVFSPSTPVEFNQLFKQNYKNKNINYFRLSGVGHEVEFHPDEIKTGKAIKIKDGNKATIVVVGQQLRTVMDTDLDDIEIIYVHTVKPLDEEMVSASINKTKKCLTIEEHHFRGGINDDILRLQIPAKYDYIALDGKFIHQYGSYQNLCDILGYTSDNIIKKLDNLCQN